MERGVEVQRKVRGKFRETAEVDKCLLFPGPRVNGEDGRQRVVTYKDSGPSFQPNTSRATGTRPVRKYVITITP